MTNLLNKIPILLIQAYRHILSPFLPSSCRFYPSCSSYALESYQRYNFIKATLLTIRRIGKCHPFHPGGLDPVPDIKDKKYG